MKAKAKKELKEETKDEVKDEVKEELKEEMKEEAEIKEEPKDERDAKKSKQAEAPVDLSTCPPKIVIQASGKKSVDGTYKLMAETSRGKPAYVLEGGKKKMYLHCYKKWLISIDEMDKKKYMMSCQDAGLSTPCEPYPYLWRSFDKNESGEKFEVISYGMRVIDASVKESLDAELPLQPLEQSAATEVNAAADGEGAPAKKHKKSHKDKADGDKDGAAKSAKDEAKAAKAKEQSQAEKAAAEAKKKKVAEEDAWMRDLEKLKLVALTKVAREEGVDSAVLEECEEKAEIIKLIVEAKRKKEKVPPPIDDDEAAPSSDAESASEAESEASDSSSSSDSASEPPSSPAQPPAPAPRATPPATPPPAPSPPQPPSAPPPAAKNMVHQFEEKMRAQIAKLKEPKLIKQQLASFKTKFSKADQVANLEKMGVTPEKVEELIKNLEKEYLKPTPSQPKGPPPRHLLGNDDGKPQSVQLNLPGTTVAPSTPPEDLSKTVAPAATVANPDALPHRTHPAPTKSKLRDAWGVKRHEGMRISYVDIARGEAVVKLAAVESMRNYGAHLWFQSPGSTVFCDQCDQPVPQACGSLQGEPNKSQFAQNRFVCSTCMGCGPIG